MEKVKEATKKLCDMKEKLICALEPQLLDIQSLDAEEAGEVVDMIKDFCEAEYYVMKSKYYEKVIESMKEAEEARYNETRMGYNNRRYADGRYAPAGRGEVSGFKYPPDTWTEPMRMGYGEEEWERSGYQGQGGGRGSSSNSGGRGSSNMNSSGGNNSNYGYTPGKPMMMEKPRYGMPYMDYQDARRFYSESHSEEDKKKMEEHAKKHLHDSIDTMKDIWRDAEPQLKQQMKQDLQKLINDMN